MRSQTRNARSGDLPGRPGRRELRLHGRLAALARASCRRRSTTRPRTVDGDGYHGPGAYAGSRSRDQVQTHGLQARGTLQRRYRRWRATGFLQHSGLRVGDTTQLFVNSAFFRREDRRARTTCSRRWATPAGLRRSWSWTAPARRPMLNANPRGPLTYPDEYWIKGQRRFGATGTAAISAGTLAGSLTSFDDAAARRSRRTRWWRQAGRASCSSASRRSCILSAIGFLIYSYLTAQRRTLEFAVLRTMGFSKHQIATVVGFEQSSSSAWAWSPAR